MRERQVPRVAENPEARPLLRSGSTLVEGAFGHSDNSGIREGRAGQVAPVYCPCVGASGRVEARRTKRIGSMRAARDLRRSALSSPSAVFAGQRAHAEDLPCPSLVHSIPSQLPKPSPWGNRPWSRPRRRGRRGARIATIASASPGAASREVCFSLGRGDCPIS